MLFQEAVSRKRKNFEKLLAEEEKFREVVSRREKTTNQHLEASRKSRA